MSKQITWFLILLLIGAVFLIPMFLPSEETYYGEESAVEESDDFDLDFKKKKLYKSARSVGGSRSFRSGK